MCSCEQTIAAMQYMRDIWDSRASESQRGSDVEYANTQAISITNDIAHVIDSHAYCVKERERNEKWNI